MWLALLGVIAFDLWAIPAIGERERQYPNTDAAGMLAMSVVFITLGVATVCGMAVLSHLKRWHWRRTHSYRPPRQGHDA
jgi:hypothetical protein